MILIGIVLILLGGVFLFAGLTGMPRAVLGGEKETTPSPVDNLPARDHNPPQTPSETSSPENVRSDMSLSTDPDDHSSPSESPESVPSAPAENTPIASAPEYATPEIPISRRISSIILGIMGLAFGILALLDSM